MGAEERGSRGAEGKGSGGGMENLFDSDHVDQINLRFGEPLNCCPEYNDKVSVFSYLSAEYSYMCKHIPLQERRQYAYQDINR